MVERVDSSEDKGIWVGYLMHLSHPFFPPFSLQFPVYFLIHLHIFFKIFFSLPPVCTYFIFFICLCFYAIFICLFISFPFTKCIPKKLRYNERRKNEDEVKKKTQESKNGKRYWRFDPDWFPPQIRTAAICPSILIAVVFHPASPFRCQVVSSRQQ